MHLNVEELCEILQHKNAQTETAASDVASKMTEGLTTFLHTHSLGDASQLNTSDVSGLTIRTQRTQRNRTDKSHMSARNRSEATQWDWDDATDKTDKTDALFSFEGYQSSLFAIICFKKIDGEFHQGFHQGMSPLILKILR